MKTLIVAVVAAGMMSVAAAAEPLAVDQAGRRLQEKADQREADANAPATKAEVERLRKQVAVLMDEVAALQKMVHEMQKAPAAEGGGVTGAGLRGDAAAEIKKAIRENRLTLGMTLADANKAMDRAGTLVREDAIEQVYEWNLMSARVSATFQGGKLMDHSRESKTAGRRPAPPSSGSFNPSSAGR